MARNTRKYAPEAVMEYINSVDAEKNVRSGGIIPPEQKEEIMEIYVLFFAIIAICIVHEMED